MDLTFESSGSRRRRVIRAVAEQLDPAVARSSLFWHQIEPTKGVRDWSRHDAVIAELLDAGIEPLMVIRGSPSWANGVGGGIEGHFLHVPAGPPFDRWLVEYEDFVGEAVARYRGQVRKWELWNEPNHSAFWRPEPDVGRYERFLRAISSAIRTADPTAKVASGGLACLTSCGDKGVDGLAFLAALADAGALPDIVALHPYASAGASPDLELPGRNSFLDVADARELLHRRGWSGALWLTEFGWSSQQLGGEGQAASLRTALAALTAQADVTLAVVFLDFDRPGLPYGLLDQRLGPKPAAKVFRDVVRLLARSRSFASGAHSGV